MSVPVVWYAKARRLIIPYNSNTSRLWDDNIPVYRWPCEIMLYKVNSAPYHQAKSRRPLNINVRAYIESENKATTTVELLSGQKLLVGPCGSPIMASSIYIGNTIITLDV
jgi:hypothetical protein